MLLKHTHTLDPKAFLNDRLQQGQRQKNSHPGRQERNQIRIRPSVASVIINEELESISVSLSPSIPFNLHLPVKLQVMNGVGKMS